MLPLCKENGEILKPKKILKLRVFRYFIFNHENQYSKANNSLAIYFVVFETLNLFDERCCSEPKQTPSNLKSHG